MTSARRASTRGEGRSASGTADSSASESPRLSRLSDELRTLEGRLRLGGGGDRVKRQHAQGKLSARERVVGLCDAGSRFLEIGLLVAYDQYDGQAPAAGVVTGIGMVHDREVVVVANDATVKAGSWWPETIRKILRAQEIAMRCRVPIVYLVDSAGVNLPYQGGVFPGQYGAARIFYYNSIMRRYLRVPQLAAVMGQCIAGGAYLPALSDVIVMVKGTSFMGLGGPNLVKGATGQTVDVGGARRSDHPHRAQWRGTLRGRRRRGVPREAAKPHWSSAVARAPASPLRSRRPSPGMSTTVLPADHRMSYDMHAVLRAILDGGAIDEFQQQRAREIICGDGAIEGQTVGVIANQRGLIKGLPGERPRFGGIIYPESAEKVAYYIDRCDRQGIPAPLRAGRFGLHGGAGSRASRHHPGGRAVGGSDGDRAGAEDRAHHQPRVGRRLLRHGRSGVRSRFHLHLADRTHGGDGGRVGSAGRPRSGVWPPLASPGRRPRPT